MLPNSDPGVSGDDALLGGVSVCLRTVPADHSPGIPAAPVLDCCSNSEDGEASEDHDGNDDGDGDDVVLLRFMSS